MTHPKLVFVTFGSDGGYTYLAKDLLFRLKKAYPHADTVCYTAKDLSIEYREYAKSYPRGYGYFYFKPIIIDDIFKKLSNDTIVVYFEARVHFRDHRITWLDDFLEKQIERSYDMISVMDSSLLEQEWTSGDILEDLNVYENRIVLESGQFGTPYVFRINPVTRALVTKWLDYMTNNLVKCRDESSTIPNKKTFIENRYDQSVMSILMKTDPKLRIKALPPNYLNKKNSVYSNYKSHPTSLKVKTWNLLKINLNPILIYNIIKIKDYITLRIPIFGKKKFYWE